MKILFILKIRNSGNYSSCNGSAISTGLWNSAQFISDMLNNNKIKSKVVQVIDNNCIDREVFEYKPDIVIIEALWVVPDKFDVLAKLHPNVKWIVRIHSEIPFIANEGIAIDWIFNYIKHPNVCVSTNSLRMFQNLVMINDSNKIIYLPNYYPVNHTKSIRIPITDEINIGCFGAIRPMKNHLSQAFAAIKYAEENELRLNFHINSSVEMYGDSILRNLVGLFNYVAGKGHKLIIHDIVSHDKFLEVVKTMDVGMQVSFSETFNIVSSDFIVSNIPMITSKEISWISPMYHADPNSVDDIVEKLGSALSMPKLNVILNKWRLKRFVNKSKRIWLRFLEHRNK